MPSDVVSSPRMALSHRVSPSMRTGSSGSVASSGRREVRARRRPSASRPVVRGGGARSGRRAPGRPARPSPGTRPVHRRRRAAVSPGQAEAALAAARAAEGKDAAAQPSDHRHRRDGPASVVSSTDAPSPSPSRPPRRGPDRRRGEAAGQTAPATAGDGQDRRHRRRRRRSCSATRARPIAMSASRRRTWSANHAPNPAVAGAGGWPQHGGTDDRDGARRRSAATTTVAAAIAAPSDPTRLTRAATSAPMTSDRATTPPDPIGGSRRASLGPRRVGRQQGVGRIGQAVEMQAPADEAARRRPRGWPPGRGSAAPTTSTGRAAEQPPMPRPDEREGRAPPARRRGVQLATPTGIRRAADRSAARRSAAERGHVGNRTHGRGRPRRPTGSGRRRASSAGGPSATIRPSAMTTTRSKKWRGQGQVVEDGEDRRAVPTVQVDQQLHDLDLVADVEVGGRLVEDEDRRFLGQGQGDEHQLPLAHRQFAHVAATQVGDADPLDGRVDGVEVRAGGVRSGAARAAAGRGRRRPRRASRTAPARAPGRRRWSGRHPVGRVAGSGRRPGGPGRRRARGCRSGSAAASTCRRRSARRWRSGRRSSRSRTGTSRMRRPPASTCSPSAWMDGRTPVAVVTARTPGAIAGAGTGRTARRAGP